MTPKGFYAGRTSGHPWKRLAALALLALLLVWSWPWWKNLPRIVRLYREPPPASLPMPVQGIDPSQITDTWGGARSEGRTHEGTDIFALRGTPVISTTHGVVVRKGWNRLGGRRVLVLGPAGWNHYYAHLDEWSAVGLGDWVEVGTVLGYVGDSGDAQGTPTHLHYGIYVGGAATNPYPLLTRGLSTDDDLTSEKAARPSPHPPAPSPVPPPALPHRERGRKATRGLRSGFIAGPPLFSR